MTPNASHPASLPAPQLLASCRMQLLRRGGPGGQHRNKVETAVVLVHLPTGVRAEANERRSQAANRGAAVFRLRVSLALAVRRPVAPDAAPSPLWRERCSPAGTIAIRPDHDDFPAMLAEALDTLAAVNDDLPHAAAILGSTASQLVKFLKKEP
ncbi:MAG: peptide chain release factor-like protein, partial [Planctomycetia bacterium]|nr:peptide chain release factor-like protein [Planctomycetia bacterium]